jgi:hypothetical protein
VIRPYSSVLNSPRLWLSANGAVARASSRATNLPELGEAFLPLEQEVIPGTSTQTITSAEKVFILRMTFLLFRTEDVVFTHGRKFLAGSFHPKDHRLRLQTLLQQTQKSKRRSE